MKKKIGIMLWTTIIWISSAIIPLSSAYAWYNGWNWFTNQATSTIWVAEANKGGSWSTSFLDFIQSAVNWILWILGLITIIILIWWGFQMVTAAWDDGKYKKWFTILKQAVIWLIMIWVSALIVNLIFSFVNSNTTTSGWAGGWQS